MSSWTASFRFLPSRDSPDSLILSLNIPTTVLLYCSGWLSMNITCEWSNTFREAVDLKFNHRYFTLCLGKTAWYRLFAHARNIPFIRRIFSSIILTKKQRCLRTAAYSPSMQALVGDTTNTTLEVRPSRRFSL